MHSHIAARREQLAQVCRRFSVRRLEVFGSASKGGFDIQHSDVDLLVQFDETGADPLDEYFGLKTELEAVLDRPVDLLVAGALRNPYVLADIDASRQVVYGS